MQFLALITLLPLALARPSIRTVATVEADIAGVSTDLTSFDASILAFTGKLTQALALLSAYDTLSSAVQSTTTAVTSNGALDSADSATIYASVTSLTTEIEKTLTDAVAQVGLLVVPRARKEGTALGRR